MDQPGDSIELLRDLIRVPSFSTEEYTTADIISGYLEGHGIRTHRKHNNVWVYNKHFDAGKPTVLLNSHHDTVKPNDGYTRDPFDGAHEDGKIFGLGSNDAGGALVSLIATFIHFCDREDMNYNLCLAATAEEEISGSAGVSSILEDLGRLEFAIVGEPTGMHLAIAERGLMVLDCTAHGKAGHAARSEGENAIYKALKDIEWFRKYQFPKTSALLGSVKMTVTIINAGSQHNVVPASCGFVVDVRVPDVYNNEEVLGIINQHVQCTVNPRSLRLNPSSIDPNHPLVQAGIKLGRKTYGSPTLSDQALLNVPSLKIGPGESQRSHMADEFIYEREIREGIDLYIKLIEAII